MPSIRAQVYDFPDEDIEVVVERIRRLLGRREFLTLGRYGDELEEAFASYHGNRYAVAVNSGTAALEVILRVVGVSGGEVIVPTNTFAATAFAVLHAGARPVFADCGVDLILDPADVASRITSRTRAVVVVHIGGLISPVVEQLRDICAGRDICLVEDAAHAHGSRLDGAAAGSWGSAAAYSFFSTKVMTTGEGGMVVTEDQDMAAMARLLRDQAKVGNANLHEIAGYNWRMSELHAILGLSQVARLEEFVTQRQRVARVYDSVLRERCEQLRPLEIPPQAECNYYKYVVLVEGDEPQRIQREMSERYGISMGGFVYEVPCHEQPVFAEFGRPLPNAERLCRSHICPPIYPSLTSEQAHRVAEALCEVVS
jgi:dTDP-4-amino-4,6-dideoxygalactose transaminase